MWEVNTSITSLVLSTSLCCSIPLITNALLFWGQVLASKYIFLQKKLDENDEDQPLALTNRCVYTNYSHKYEYE